MLHSLIRSLMEKLGGIAAAGMGMFAGMILFYRGNVMLAAILSSLTMLFFLTVTVLNWAVSLYSRPRLARQQSAFWARPAALHAPRTPGRRFADKVSSVA